MTRARDLSNLIGYKTSDNQETLTAIAGQTSFTVTNGYTAGFVNVYMNGLLLDPVVDYTATDGTNIVLTDAAQAGDELEVVKYQTFSASDTINASGGTFTGGVSFNSNITLTGNLDFEDVAQLYGNGTQSNPFKGLEGATEYSKVHAIADGTYYVEFDGTSYQAPFVFQNTMANHLNYQKPPAKAWMKVTSAVASISSLSAGASVGISGDVNAQLSSAGVVTMDYIENTGCGESHCTYDIDLVDGCHYNFIQLNAYRPHSLHQCLGIFTERNADFTRVSGSDNAQLIGLFGAADAGQFTPSGTWTQASSNPADDGGGPNVSQCSWSSSIHADNGGGSASTTSYDHLAFCAFYQTSKAFTNIVLHFNCAAESTIAQTNTTHEYWIAV